MSQKISSATTASQDRALSTAETMQEKKKYQAQQETRRASFAKHLEAHHGVQREARRGDAQLDQKTRALEDHDARQMSQAAQLSDHEQQLGEHNAQGDALARRLSAEEHPVTREEDLTTPPDETIMEDSSPELKRAPCDEPLQPVDGVQELHTQSSPTPPIEEPTSPQDVRAVVQMAEQLVKACSVGHDARARKVMMLDVEVPGKGEMRVRLTRDGDGVNVRLRASDDATRTWLKAHQGNLRDEAAKQGVVFKRIEVV